MSKVKNKENKADRTIMVNTRPLSKLQQLSRQRKSFRMVQTAGMARFEMEDGVVWECSRRKKDFKFLGLVSKLRREVSKCLEKKGEGFTPEEVPVEKIPYFMYNKALMSGLVEVNQTMELTNVMEYDITKAYYQAGYRLGYISREFYEECLELDKPIRLKLMGTLATQQTVAVFKDGKETGFNVVRNEAHTKVWFHICWYVARCMYQFMTALGDDFLFYWVDGIYFDARGKETADEFVHYAGMEYDFRFTKEDVEKIVVTGREEGNLVEVFKNGGVKPFNLPRTGRGEPVTPEMRAQIERMMVNQ